MGNHYFYIYIYIYKKNFSFLLNSTHDRSSIESGISSSLEDSLGLMGISRSPTRQSIRLCIMSLQMGGACYAG